MDDHTERRLCIGPGAAVQAIDRAGERGATDEHDLLAHFAADYEREAAWRALQGLDDEATDIAIRAHADAVRKGLTPDPAATHPRLVRALDSVDGLDTHVALEMSRRLDDLLVTTMDGRHVYSSWIGGDGRREYRVAIGGGVDVCQDGTVVIPELPDTILAALPGRPLSTVVRHGAFTGDETIRAVAPTRCYGSLWRNGLTVA